MPELSEKGIVEGFVQHLNPHGLMKNPALLFVADLANPVFLCEMNAVAVAPQ